MPRIHSLTLNTATDVLLKLDRLEPGQLHQAEIIGRRPAGKGLNVSRVLAIMGVDSDAIGFVGKHDKTWFETDLVESGVTGRFVGVDGATRVNTTIMETGVSGRGETHIRTTGYTVSESDIDRLRDVLTAVLEHGDLVCVSGSLPPGIQPDQFRDMLVAMRNAGVKLAIDTSGAALVAALDAEPDILTPNREELLSMKLAEGAAESLAVLADQGVHWPVCTLGADGAMIASGGEIIRRTPPPVDVVSTVGSGDAFLAGLIVGWMNGDDADDALMQAVACGASATMNAWPGVIDPVEVEAIRRRMASPDFGHE